LGLLVLGDAGAVRLAPRARARLVEVRIDRLVLVPDLLRRGRGARLLAATASPAPAPAGPLARVRERGLGVGRALAERVVGLGQRLREAVDRVDEVEVVDVDVPGGVLPVGQLGVLLLE